MVKVTTVGSLARGATVVLVVGSLARGATVVLVVVTGGLARGVITGGWGGWVQQTSLVLAYVCN